MDGAALWARRKSADKFVHGPGLVESVVDVPPPLELLCQLPALGKRVPGSNPGKTTLGVLVV